MPESRGEALRRRREELGLGLQEVADATRIPAAHLRALEDDRITALPAGPYANAYLRVVRAYLGSSESDGLGGHQRPSRDDVPSRSVGAPLPAVRALAVVSVVALVGMLVSALWPIFTPSGPMEDAPPPVGQQLAIKAERNTHLQVWVDGRLALAREVAGGEELSFAGERRIELQVEAVEDVRVIWNGSRVRPLGQQTAPRRLVFVDDVRGGAP